MAEVSLLEPADDDTVASAHEHLRAECPWYAHASDGQPVADFKQHCEPAEGKNKAPRLVVKATGPVIELTPRTPEASTVPKPTRPPGGPGLFHIKGRELPPYIQHLWHHLRKEYGDHEAYRVAVGVVKKWAAGIHPGGPKGRKGGHRVHADVQAAAQKNVEEWEKDKADAHAQSAARKRGKAGHAVAATGPNLEKVLALADRNTVPGLATPRGDQYGLHQHPSQTTAPSPPLPPKVAVPTPEEVRALISQVPECSEVHQSNAVKNFLETAAVKLSKDAELDALAMLRSAGAAIFAAHKADLGKVMPHVFNARIGARVPPAEQSSANAAMRQGTDRAQEWRKLEMAVQALSDRLRKRFFRGVYNGPGQLARLTEGNMSALDKVLALAGHQQVATGSDVSFPTESDTSLRTPLLQPPATDLGIDGDAAQELSRLGPLDKVRINAYLGAARGALAENPAGATQFLARAKVLAKEAGAYDLARHLHQHIEAVAYGSNHTHSQAEAESRPGNEVNRESPSGANVKLSARVRL